MGFAHFGAFFNPWLEFPFPFFLIKRYFCRFKKEEEDKSNIQMITSLDSENELGLQGSKHPCL